MQAVLHIVEMLLVEVSQDVAKEVVALLVATTLHRVLALRYMPLRKDFGHPYRLGWRSRKILIHQVGGNSHSFAIENETFYHILGTQRSQESVPSRKRENPSAGTSCGSSKGKTLRQKHSGANSFKRPRRQFSDVSETVTASTSEESEEGEKERIPCDKSSLRSHRHVVRASRKKIPFNCGDSEDERSTEKCK